MGAEFTASPGGMLPLMVRGLVPAIPISYRLPVASAQVKSAVLLAGLNIAGITEVIEPVPTVCVKRKSSALAMVESAAEQLGGLDVVIVNTGGGKPGGILDTSGFDDAAFNSMLRPALEIARSASAHLRTGTQSRLIFLTARSVVEATPDLALSSVFRSGVTAAARSLALELAPFVNVNVVVTGQFETPALSRFEEALAASSGMSLDEVRAHHVEAIPLKRVGTAREFANVVAFLCSRASSFVTGSVVRVDGGSVKGF
jgi:NAD(P)-dependent dehydrogenase (short-subunit alcohol dehydrogenase family)